MSKSNLSLKLQLSKVSGNAQSVSVTKQLESSRLAVLAVHDDIVANFSNLA